MSEIKRPVSIAEEIAAIKTVTALEQTEELKTRRVEALKEQFIREIRSGATVYRNSDLWRLLGEAGLHTWALEYAHSYARELQIPGPLRGGDDDLDDEGSGEVRFY